jgi:hypothetical protein
LPFHPSEWRNRRSAFLRSMCLADLSRLILALRFRA